MYSHSFGSCDAKGSMKWTAAWAMDVTSWTSFTATDLNFELKTKMLEHQVYIDDFSKEWSLQ